MVILFFSDGAEFVNEIQRLLEILEVKFAFDFLVVDDRPIIHLRQEGRYVSAGKFADARTRLTPFVRERIHLRNIPC